jgi:RNA polymerase sigma-70 factor (ECF subfamily)
MKNKADINKLVQKLAKGNMQAFNQLFEQYSTKLYYFAYGYLKSKEDAEELVQEVFIKIWEKRNDLKQEYDLQSYIFTIAYNQVKKYFRAKNIVNKYLEYAKQEQAKPLVTEPEISYTELNGVISNLINRMPEKRKLVFIKSRIEGKNIPEISEEMQISKKTAENHLHTALKFLKTELAREHFIAMLFFYLHFF